MRGKMSVARPGARESPATPSIRPPHLVSSAASEESAIAAFLGALRSAFESFQAEERAIRAQYARDVERGEVPSGADDDELLERPTRRFLIDRMLRALDWSPDDPGQIVE
jgi:hypothetical protein